MFRCTSKWLFPEHFQAIQSGDKHRSNHACESNLATLIDYQTHKLMGTAAYATFSASLRQMKRLRLTQISTGNNVWLTQGHTGSLQSRVKLQPFSWGYLNEARIGVGRINQEIVLGRYDAAGHL